MCDKVLRLCRKMRKNTEVMIYPKNWRGRKQTWLNIKNWCIQVTEIRSSLDSFHFLSRFEILQHNFLGKYFKVRKKKSSWFTDLESMSAAPGDHDLLRAKPRLCQGPLFCAQSWAQVGRKLSDQWMMDTGMKFWLQHVHGVAFGRRLPEPLQSRYNTALQAGPLSPLGPSRAVGIFSGPSKQCHYYTIIITTTQCFKNP